MKGPVPRGLLHFWDIVSAVNPDASHMSGPFTTRSCGDGHKPATDRHRGDLSLNQGDGDEPVLIAFSPFGKAPRLLEPDAPRRPDAARYRPHPFRPARGDAGFAHG